MTGTAPSVSNERAKKVLGWEPTIELEEGLVRTLGTQLAKPVPAVSPSPVTTKG